MEVASGNVRKPKENLRFFMILGRKMGHVGAVLGPSWAFLGPSWGRFGAVLGPSWVRLGRAWGRLGYDRSFVRISGAEERKCAET